MKTRPNPSPQLVALAVSVALMAIAITGCRSAGKPASASFAPVIIAGHSFQEIQETTAAVFQADGYRAYRKPDGTMMFEREGSKKNQIAYSGLAGAHYGERVNVRVRAEIVDLGAGSHRLQCHAFMVRNAGDSFFEEEKPLSNIRGRSYQKLLDEVAKRLQ